MFGPKYPVKVTIIEKRAGNYVIDYDFARRIRKGPEGVVIELKRRRRELPPISLNYFFIDKQGRTHLFLFTPDNEKFYPIKLEIAEDNNVKLLQEKAWDVVDQRLALELRDIFKPKTFLEKYGNFLYLLIFGFIMLMGMYIVFTKLSEIATIVKTATELAKKTLEIVKQVPANKTVIPPKPPY